MNFLNANAVDVLRCSQKDEQFTDLYVNKLFEIARLCGSKFTKNIYPLGTVLYYYFTSFSNLQTLGEEYTGILRLYEPNNNIPNKWIHILWLAFYIGGDKMYRKTLNHFEQNLKENNSLTPDAKRTLLKLCKTFKDNKDIIIRFHQAVFYTEGKYYNISNRVASIKYVYLRSWMKRDNDQSKETFQVLGKLSLTYLFCMVIYKLYHSYHQLRSAERTEENNEPKYAASRQEECCLCAQIKTYPSTLPCGHIFCWNCIFNIINYEPKCPVCRDVIQPSRVILLQNY